MSEENATTAREIFGLMLALAREIRCCSREETFCGDLTFQQFAILDAVAQAGELDLAALHGILAVEKSTTTRLLDPLLRRGLLSRRKAAHDSRAARLSLTAAGRRTHGEVWACLSDFLAALSRQFGEGERAAVFDAVRRFAGALGKAAADCRCGGHGAAVAGPEGNQGREGVPGPAADGAGKSAHRASPAPTGTGKTADGTVIRPQAGKG